MSDDMKRDLATLGEMTSDLTAEVLRLRAEVEAEREAKIRANDAAATWEHRHREEIERGQRLAGRCVAAERERDDARAQLATLRASTDGSPTEPTLLPDARCPACALGVACLAHAPKVTP